MWLTYRPSDGEKQEWWVRTEKISDREAEMIEIRSGFDWEEWKQKVLGGNRRARRALLWALLRREHHTLKYDDVRFTDEQLELEMDAQEIGEMIQNAESKRERQELTDREEQVLANLQRVLPDARPAGKVPEPDGA